MDFDDEASNSSTTTCTQEAAEAGSIKTFYDPSSELVNLVATLNNGSFAGWGWGEDMTNTEMVIFSANGSQSAVSFVYGQGEQDPVDDAAFAACYSSSFVVHSDSTVTITTTRPLECSGITDPNGDSYVVQLDTDMSLCMAWNPDSPELSYHNSNRSQFTFML